MEQRFFPGGRTVPWTFALTTVKESGTEQIDVSTPSVVPMWAPSDYHWKTRRFTPSNSAQSTGRVRVPVTVQVFDASHQPVADAEVNLSAVLNNTIGHDHNADAVFDDVFPAGVEAFEPGDVCVTDSNGSCGAVTFTTPPTSGNYTIVASRNGVQGWMRRIVRVRLVGIPHAERSRWSCEHLSHLRPVLGASETCEESCSGEMGQQPAAVQQARNAVIGPQGKTRRARICVGGKETTFLTARPSTGKVTSRLNTTASYGQLAQHPRAMRRCGSPNEVNELTPLCRLIRRKSQLTTTVEQAESGRYTGSPVPHDNCRSWRRLPGGQHGRS